MLFANRKKSLAKNVVSSIVYCLLGTGTVVIITLAIILELTLGNAEQKYMEEVITRVDLEINRALDPYIIFAEGISQNKALNAFLVTVVTDTAEGHQNPVDPTTLAGYDEVISELNIGYDTFSDTVRSVLICSVHKDNYFNQNGERGDVNYSLKTAPFYQAVVQGSTYISDPYQEEFSGTVVIAIASPMFDDKGEIHGIFVFEITLAQIAQVVQSASFGETGNTYILDRNNNILVYSDSSYVGKSVDTFDYIGDDFLAELANPTGSIVNYERFGVKRVGGISEISTLSQWKVVSGMDSAEFQTSIQQVILVVAVLQALALLLVAGVSGYKIVCSVKPLSELEGFMEELAQGNLGQQLHINRQDEIGRLGRSMNRTAENLSGYISHIEENMNRLLQGEMMVDDTMEYHGSFRTIQESMLQFVAMMSQSLRTLNLAISKVNETAFTMANGSQNLASGATQQAGSVQELNALIDSINDTIKTTAENSSSVSGEAEVISRDLLGSNQKMQDLVVSVKDIRQMSEKVKEIIKTIEDVAFQTNILSLNASIEAARAGTAGKGFAVVADEVRNLSQKTAEAAEETNKIIGDIANAIETGTNLAESTSKDLQQVVDDVEIFVGKVSNISLSTQNQAEAIGEIQKGVGQIASVTQHNAVFSEESADASEKLTAESQQMLEQVSQFKLKDEKKRGFG